MFTEHFSRECMTAKMFDICRRKRNSIVRETLKCHEKLRPQATYQELAKHTLRERDRKRGDGGAGLGREREKRDRP